MTYRLNIYGVDVQVTRGIPSEYGETVRVRFPDGTEKATRLPQARNIEQMAAFEVDVWRKVRAREDIQRHLRSELRTKEAA